MEIKHKIAITASEVDFFADIAKIFQKYPGMNEAYSISSRKLLKKLIDQKKSGQKIIQRWDNDKIIIELSNGSNAEHSFGCCKYCVDDEGRTYCCVSGPDC